MNQHWYCWSSCIKVLCRTEDAPRRLCIGLQSPSVRVTVWRAGPGALQLRICRAAAGLSGGRARGAHRALGGRRIPGLIPGARGVCAGRRAHRQPGAPGALVPGLLRRAGAAGLSETSLCLAQFGMYGCAWRAGAWATAPNRCGRPFRDTFMPGSNWGVWLRLARWCLGHRAEQVP